MPRHFIDISCHDGDTLRSILNRAGELKSGAVVNQDTLLKGRMLAMIFDKPSTRTRVSFDVGMRQLGGETIPLDGATTQLGQGESIADTARVLSRYVDAIMIRTTAHERLLELAEHATVPVINALTDSTHPCQIMADIMTFEEHRGDISDKKVAWCGDGNNVVHSFIEASARFGFNLSVATPENHPPSPQFMEWAKKNGAEVELSNEPERAVQGADCVITDKWLSMGAEKDRAVHNIFAPFQVNESLMSHANDEAIFMHCLPAKRGEEVTDEVIDGTQSVVFDEAENRLHAQKSILAWCLLGDS